MKNYMKQVADMLDIELGEEFELGTSRMKYVLSEDGLFCVADNRCCDHVLINILKGYVELVRVPWIPEYNDVYWTIGRNGDIVQCAWYDDMIDVYCYKLGNCYKTENEASANKDKWIQFYELDEVLEWS